MTIRFVHPSQEPVVAELGAQPRVVGRPGAEADIAVPDLNLSRRHGRLWVEGDDVWYEDLGSVNGSWYQGSRLQARLRLVAGEEVRLGPTWQMTLSSSTAAPAVASVAPEGESGEAEVQMEGQVGSQGLTQALGGASWHNPAVAYISALYGMVEQLLGTRGVESIPQVLQRLRQEIPAAQRVALVRWPPQADGSWEHLVPSSEPRDFVSRTLAGQAIERKRALLVAGGAPPDGVAMPFSAQIKGIHNAFYVPLHSPEGAVLGVLCVDCPVANVALTAEHFQFVCAVGGLLATALNADRLREEARLHQLETRQAEARREGLASFLRIASHDLKNPLQAIIGGARLMSRVPPEKQPPLVEMILRAGERATDLIRTYLDAAEADSGAALAVDWSELEPRDLVEAELELLKSGLAERLAAITLENAVDCGPIRADARKLRQIVANLLSNAIKYSPSGGQVEIRAERGADGVRFAVKDQGVGISAADQKRLFGAFQRVGDRNVAPGSGLGLWLTAALVQAQGGRIGLDSSPGHGSTFWFTIPQGLT